MSSKPTYKDSESTGGLTCETLPTLQFHPSDREILNAYWVVYWLSAIKNFVEIEYGNIATVFDLSNPRMSQIVLKTAPENFTPEQQAAVNSEYMKDYVRQDRYLDEKKEKVYGLIWGLLSTTSQAKVEACVEYISIKENKDLFTLITLFKRVHFSYGETDDMEGQLKVQGYYRVIFQQKGKSVHTIFMKFEAFIDALRSLGSPIPSDAIQGGQLVDKLNKKWYGVHVLNYKNLMYARHSNLQEAYTWASKLHVIKNDLLNPINNVSYTDTAGDDMATKDFPAKGKKIINE